MLAFVFKKIKMNPRTLECSLHAYAGLKKVNPFPN